MCKPLCILRDHLRVCVLVHVHDPFEAHFVATFRARLRLCDLYLILRLAI